MMEMTNEEKHRFWLEQAEHYAEQKQREAAHVHKLYSGSDRFAIDREVDRDPKVNGFQIMHDRAVQNAIMYGIAALVAVRSR